MQLCVYVRIVRQEMLMKVFSVESVVQRLRRTHLFAQTVYSKIQMIVCSVLSVVQS